MDAISWVRRSSCNGWRGGTCCTGPYSIVDPAAVRISHRGPVGYSGDHGRRRITNLQISRLVRCFLRRRCRSNDGIGRFAHVAQATELEPDGAEQTKIGIDFSSQSGGSSCRRESRVMVHQKAPIDRRREARMQSLQDP